MTRGRSRKIDDKILHILKTKKKLTKKELLYNINITYTLKAPIPESTLNDKLTELIRSGKVIEQNEKIGKRSQKTFSLSFSELEKLSQEYEQHAKKLEQELKEKLWVYKTIASPCLKELVEKRSETTEKLGEKKIATPTLEEIQELKREIEKCQKNHSYDLSAYGGPNGIHKINDREKAKELFDVYLRILTRQFVNSIFYSISKIAFSSESEALKERIKKGDAGFSVRDDVAGNLIVSGFQKNFARALFFLSYLTVELFANFDVAFGDYVEDPKSSVNQFIEELMGKFDEVMVDRVHLSQKVGDIIDQQNMEYND